MQNKPTKFLEYLQSNFNDQENFEKLLDFISTIPNQKPKNKKLTVFIGLPRTGKTTLISQCAYTVNTEFAACALKITALIMEKSK